MFVSERVSYVDLYRANQYLWSFYHGMPPARLYYSIKLSMKQNEALTIVINLAKNYVNIFHFSTGVSIRNYKFFSISSHRRNFVLAKNRNKNAARLKNLSVLILCTNYHFGEVSLCYPVFPEYVS